MDIFYKLKELLIKEGADFVDFCSVDDIYEIKEAGFFSAISIGLSMKADVVAELEKGPSINYYNECLDIYKRLDRLGHIVVKFLQSKDYNTHYPGAVRKKDSHNKQLINIPHSKIATKCGVGWIGKCNILITKKYGASIRLTTVLSNLKYKDQSNAITESQCGDCCECVKACPVGAPLGMNWTYGIDQKEIFDAVKCAEAAKKRKEQNKGLEHTFCSKCIMSCPYTKKYVKNN